MICRVTDDLNAVAAPIKQVKAAAIDLMVCAVVLSSLLSREPGRRTGRQPTSSFSGLLCFFECDSKDTSCAHTETSQSVGRSMIPLSTPVNHTLPIESFEFLGHHLTFVLPSRGELKPC